jgi:Rrf2 family transcriptional repressor of oqxAB
MDFVKEGSSVSPRWFGLALQALVILMDSNHVCSSTSIADNTNAGVTFMRRVMAPLVKANIVKAREGRDGGYLLAKPAHLIRLSEVYRALQVSNPLSVALEETLDENFPHRQDLCPVFAQIAERAEQQILKLLDEYTIADLAAAQNRQP